MSRKTDDYGMMYKDDPILGKKLTIFGAFVPWMICVFGVAPLLVFVVGLRWYAVTMIMPWVGLLLSVLWINVNP